MRINLEAGWARDALKGPDGAAIAAHQEATSSIHAAFNQAGRGNIGGEKCELWIAPAKWAHSVDRRPVERGSLPSGGAVDLGIERRRSLMREQFEIGLQACARKKTLFGVRGAVPISRQRLAPTLSLRRYFTRLPGERFRTSLANQIEQRAEALEQDGMITFECAAERSLL